jgi:hypothetical protein
MAGDCTCRQCCERFSWVTDRLPDDVPFQSLYLVDPLVTFEPFDYFGERNHRVVQWITYDKRPAGDTTSPRFWAKPVAVSTLLWCDANGQNALAELRFRVEVGTAHEFNSNAGPLTAAGYGSHTMTHRDDAGNFGSTQYSPATELAEVRLYAEVLVGGSVQQSRRLINIPELETLPHRFANAPAKSGVNYLVVEWRFALHDGKIYASADAYYGSPVDRNSYVAFPPVIFEPEPVGVPSHNRIAVSRTTQTLTEVVAAHYAKRRSSFKEACIPSDTSPFCGQGELVDQRSKWPWRSDGECTVWKYCNNIIGARHDSAKTALSLTIPGPGGGIEPPLPELVGSYVRLDQQGVIAGAVPGLLQGAYELTQYQGSDRLADAAFWHASQPDSSFTGIVYNAFAEEVAAEHEFLLKAIEISAVLDFDSVPINTAPCSSNAWTPIVRLLVSWVIELPAELVGTFGVGQQFVRYALRVNAPANVAFLQGDSVSFDVAGLYPQRGADGFGPFGVSPWPASFLGNPPLAFAGQWSMQLVT